MTLRKTLAALFLVAVVVTIVRETGLYDFNYYRAKTIHQLQTNWKDSSISITLEKSLFHTDFVSRKFGELPIVVIYRGDTMLHSSGRGPKVILNIEKIQPGTLWTPLYKKASYAASIRCEFNDEFMGVNGTKLINHRPSISGTLLATGQTTIVGLSSYRSSLNVIKALIAKDALNAAKQYLSSLDASTAYNIGFAK